MQGAKAAQDNRGSVPQGKRLIVCVDDFGLDDAVNGSVFALAAQGRISAAGCLVDAPRWQADAGRLDAECATLLDIGLHLNLSESFDGRSAPFGWSELVMKAYAGRLDALAMRTEIERQLDVFEAAIGRAPDFVDGHRHVHQLPVVRSALVAALRTRYAGRMPWLRDTRPARSVAGRFKAGVIGRLGAASLHRLALDSGIAQNRRMVGVYGFDGSAADHAARLAAWLAVAQDGDLLMCHTALPRTASTSDTDTDTDPIAAAREIEFEVLSGDVFGRQLAQAGVLVARLR